MFDKSRNFNIHQSTLIDASGATFNHVHGARSGIDILYGSSIADAAHDSAVTESYKSNCLEGTRTQHIDDITAWTTRVNQSQQHRLLWMWGPAGVGKSAIAKSCAEKTAEKGRLGASFFFSRTQHVDDPLRFFTTIAHQLSTKIDEYRKALDPRIQRNPALLTKGLDAQFHELIIEPFLELARRNMGVQDKTVIIDGLDECNGDPAQSKIMELVAKSVIEHGDKIPLLWAFFSRPESHINHEFSPYSSSHLFSKVELPVSGNDNGDIRRYFRDKLHLRASAGTVWPLEGTLDTLVSMVAGLWIYAATLVRFIMDQDALGPQRQLEDVLAFHEQHTQSNTESNVTVELDAFYKMIMSRVSLKHHLPTIQKALLIHHTTYKVVLHTIANILSLTLEELKHALSKLYSVLTLIPRRERDWGEPFPGSVRISFYHASFMEFLLDKTRSGKYWLEGHRHYIALATKVLRLFKALYAMNGISRDERISKLQGLLRVFPDETFPPSECLMFQDELFYNVLCKYVSNWCEGSGLPSDVIREFEGTLEEFRPFFVDWVGMLPEEKQRLVSSEEWRHLQTELPEDNHTNARKRIKAIWDFVTCRGCCRPNVPGHDSFQTPSLRTRRVFEIANKLGLASLDDIGLLAYYSYEWEAMNEDDGRSWKELIEGDDHRLTKAVSRVLAQRRDGHLILPWTYTRHLLRAFESSLERGSTSIAELVRATKAYYSTVEGFVTSDPLLLDLRLVAGHIMRERGMYDIGYILREKNGETCGDTLMNGHWEELIGKVEELLHATDDPDNYHVHIIEWSSDGQQRLVSFLRLHVIKCVQGVIEAMSSSSASGCASALVDLQQQLVKKAERIYSFGWDYEGRFMNSRSTVDKVFEQVLRDRPDLRNAVKAQTSSDRRR